MENKSDIQNWIEVKATSLGAVNGLIKIDEVVISLNFQLKIL